jgi:YgiT-type zinc finger domain-containing protein
MNCLICRQAETTDGFASVTFERGEMRFVVNGVPAQICPGCGESYVDEAVAERLLSIADAMVLTGEIYKAREYE